MLSNSANPLLATPSQAPRGEGVETGWEPPDRVMAKVKAQSRPRTLDDASGGESRSGKGSGESWFEPRRGNSKPGVAARGAGLPVSRQESREFNPSVCGRGDASVRTTPARVADRTPPPHAASPRRGAGIGARCWCPASRGGLLVRGADPVAPKAQRGSPGPFGRPQ